MSECPTCGAAVHVYRDEATDLRARLVEVEAERDRSEERWAEWFHRGTKAEAVLAAVPAPILALIASDDRYSDEVRAAARGADGGPAPELHGSTRTPRARATSAGEADIDPHGDAAHRGDPKPGACHHDPMDLCSRCRP